MSPNTIAVLRDAIALHGWTQQTLAQRCGLDRATVSLHLNGTRAVRDDHLAAYLEPLYHTEQARLVAAWLMDTLPEHARDAVLSVDTGLLCEEVRSYRPTLPHDLQSMLDWWASQLGADPELADVFRIVTRRAGWQQKTA